MADTTGLRLTNSTPGTSLDGHGRGVRSVVHITCATAWFVAVSGTAAAHGQHAHAGGPVSFGVVVGLPVVAGFAGGALALDGTRGGCRNTAGRRVDLAVGFVLVALGAAFAVTAATQHPALGIAFGTIGWLVGRWAARHDRPTNGVRHADLAFGGITVHRVLEGVAVGTMFNGSGAIGLLGAVVVAVHAGLETAAVGSLYGRRRLRAVGAVLLVQGGYVVGAIAGVGVTVVVSPSVHVGVAALVGGIVVSVGVRVTGHTSVVPDSFATG